MGGMPTEDPGSSASPDPSDTMRDELELAPQAARLDRYVLLEQIGRGSFASVWAAYDPQLDRRVALKILRSANGVEMASGAQLAEAQALARLSHPNVVAVHDVQSFAQGVFIVMEFLAGASLREWMEEPHPWGEVVRVFIEAGRGLAAAHERGLVHRDFKPSNVMFGADGRVRVLDFGLARSTVARSTTQSQTKPRVTGTPAYMAPEQHLGEPVDARSDQFAYCSALYEALYGQRPFAGRDRIALGKAKLHGDIRPAPRGSSVPAWLHAVVQRGLAVDRAARWPDMNALLDALAHDPSLVRRRWTVAIGLVLAFGGAAFGLAGLQAGDDATALICAGSERELVGVWDDAKRAELRDSFAATQLRYADDAYRRVARVLDDRTQEWVQVHREICEATMVRREQSLEQMAEQMMCLQRRLRQLSGLVTTLARADPSSVARSVEAVHGLAAPASCRERGVELHAEQLDPEWRNHVLALEGEIAEAGGLTRLGRYDEAVKVARTAIEHAQDLADADGAGRAWLAQTRALWYLGRYDDSIEASEQAMRWAAKAGDDETFAMAQLRLLRTYTSMGKYDVAEAVAKIAAVTIEDGRLGREIEAWYDLYVAMLYYRQLRWDEAVARLEHGIELRTQLFGPEHPELAAFHNTWGNTLFSQQQFEGALEHYREALRLWERNYGPEYPDIALVNNNIGAIYLERGKYDEARPYFERVVASYEASLRADTPQMAMTLGNLAEVAAIQGHRRESLALFERARQIIAAKQGDDNVSAAQLDAGAARQLLKLDEVEQAESMITRALEIQRRDAPENLPTIIGSTELLAACQYARGDFDAWRATLERLLEELQTREPEGPYTAIDLYLRAQLARQAGERETAMELAELHLAALGAVLEPDDEDLTYRSKLLIELLLEAGDHEAAATRAREALAVTHMDRADRDRWELEYLLGRAEAGRGDRAAARAALQRALEYCSGPDGNPSQAELVREQLAALGD